MGAILWQSSAGSVVLIGDRCEWMTWKWTFHMTTLRKWSCEESYYVLNSSHVHTHTQRQTGKRRMKGKRQRGRARERGRGKLEGGRNVPHPVNSTLGIPVPWWHHVSSSEQTALLSLTGSNLSLSPSFPLGLFFSPSFLFYSLPFFVLFLQTTKGTPEFHQGRRHPSSGG